MTTGDLHIDDLLTPKNMAIATGLFGFWLGTKTPGYVDGQLENFGRQLGTYIQEGMGKQPEAYGVRSTQGEDPLQKLYQAVTVLAQKNEEMISLLRDYLPKEKG